MVLGSSMAALGGVAMSDLIWLSEAQMRRIELYFPLSHGVPLVDNCRVISGIIFVIRNGLRGRDALWLTARRIRSTIASSAGAEWRVQQDLRGTGSEGRQAQSVDRQGPIARIRSPTTHRSTASVIGSRTCSENSRTGDASTHVTTDAPIPSCPPCASPQPSSSG